MSDHHPTASMFQALYEVFTCGFLNVHSAVMYVARRRAGLLDATRTGLALSPDKHPHHVKRVSHRPSEAERRRYLEIEKRRDAHATKLDIDPTVIASRPMIAELARDWSKHASKLMKWQFALLQP